MYSKNASISNIKIPFSAKTTHGIVIQLEIIKLISIKFK